MKRFSRLATALCLTSLAATTGCRKEEKPKAVATVAQDTMLLRDLAEANRNTAAAGAVDNSLSTVMTGTDLTTTSLTSQTPQNRPADSRVVPRLAADGSGILTSGSGMAPPRRANDAPTPTTVSLDRSPASGRSTPASGDYCDSPTPADQRSCLNRLIVANDADLNRTYQELIAQARKSGGSELEERFRQSQREWINERDVNCRQSESTDGRLWARARARCLGDYSSRRTSELQRNLASLRGQG
ncbi:MAG: lysozyme inhibitor LprI family protein [Gemmatimonadaceae bacterium]